MAYGNRPWVQKSWDARAAANFICGGAGAGLIVFNAFAAAQGGAVRGLWLLGGALVAVGLLCVWAEIGRPLRALNVFFNPRTSWMTREAIVAVALLLAIVLVAAGVRVLEVPVALLALAFVYCQARILRAARGIVAWREPATVSLVMLTGLVEGGALLVVTLALARLSVPWVMAIVVALAWLRIGWAAWWQQRVQRAWAPRPVRALRAMSHPLLLGGGVWAAVALLGAWLMPGDGLGRAAQVVGGLLALGSGAWFKALLITRGAYNQGFALTHLPVRGARRQPSTM
jgi:phenylacetyl-CoA:acceptor oxidoreductase subunit 2